MMLMLFTHWFFSLSLVLEISSYNFIYFHIYTISTGLKERVFLSIKAYFSDLLKWFCFASAITAEILQREIWNFHRVSWFDLQMNIKCSIYTLFRRHDTLKKKVNFFVSGKSSVNKKVYNFVRSGNYWVISLLRDFSFVSWARMVVKKALQLI